MRCELYSPSSRCLHLIYRQLTLQYGGCSHRTQLVVDDIILQSSLWRPSQLLTGGPGVPDSPAGPRSPCIDVNQVQENKTISQLLVRY